LSRAGLIRSNRLATLPLYTDKAPPEKDALIVLRTTKVDDDGVWADAVEWPKSTAYLRPGAIARKRRDQKSFLTAAAAKRHSNHFFVAVVEDAEETSSRGVEVEGFDEKKFHVTVERTSMSTTDETATLERWRRATRAASVVDRAADEANVDRIDLRRRVLFRPYERRLLPPRGEKKIRQEDAGRGRSDEEEEGDALLVATLAIEDLVTSASSRVAKAAALLEVDDPALAASLVLSAERAYAQRQQPRVRARNVTLEGSAPAIRRAARAAEALEPGLGLARVQVKIRGPPTFYLETKCRPADDANADAYLDAAHAAAVAALASSLFLDEPSPPRRESQDFDDDDFDKDAAKPKTKKEGTAPRKKEASLDDDFLDDSTTICIGLCGDVAHGKSTLVRALSTEATQRHSAERARHGATLRLGYATCVVTECAGCGSYSSVGDDEEAPPCASCGGPIRCRRVSFVDCPGHNELSGVMMSGAVSFDAVIVVAAANDFTNAGFAPQARAHLRALRALGLDRKLRGRVAVALTKSELLPVGKEGKELTAKARALRAAARGTAADGAPILPVAAPRGLGLDAVRAWIASLPCSSTTTTTLTLMTPPSPRMAGLRSFDVNKPGDAARSLKGGVVGGSVASGAIAVGDVVEIRPGKRVVGNLRCVRPLLGRVDEIKTGAKTVAVATAASGLVALRTDLDPSLFAANRLAGSVVGKSLPPVFKTLCCDDLEQLLLEDDDDEDDYDVVVVVRKTNKQKQLSTSDKDVRVYAGPSSCAAKVSRLKKGKVEVSLRAPLCVDVGARVAFEKKLDNGTLAIVATAKVVDGDRFDVVIGEAALGQAETTTRAVEGDSSSSSSSKEDPWFCDFEVVLERSLLEAAALEESDRGEQRVKIPPLELLRDGGAAVVWTNFDAVCRALGREPAMVVSFLASEYGIQASVAGKGLRIKWRRRHLREVLTGVLRAFARSFVVCSQCRGARTAIAAVRNARLELLCHDCGARRWVDKD